MTQENYKIDKPTPVYDENGNIRYYQDDEYTYVPNIKGELIDTI